MTTTGSKVIVVEDDEGMRVAIERLLDAAGIEATAYASAEAMLAGSGWKDAACVVTDVKLPEMSGLELLAELRGRSRELPLVLITAQDAPGLRDEAMRRGAAAYLPKPFRGTALLAVVRSVIEDGGKR